MLLLGYVRLGYSGIRIYSGIYSGYSAPGSRIAGMEIQVFRNKNSSQTNAYSHYSNVSYSGLIPNERALSLLRNLISRLHLKFLPKPRKNYKNIAFRGRPAATARPLKADSIRVAQPIRLQRLHEYTSRIPLIKQ